MVEKVKCSRCERSFSSRKALSQHLRDRHFAYYFGRRFAPIIAVVALVSVAAAVALPSYLANPPPATTQTTTSNGEDLLSKFLQPNERLAFHIHPELKIFVDGKELTIPANIGIEPAGSRYIHTHQSDGVIHVESPVLHDFTLGDFFKVWGKRFDETCFDTHCGQVRVTVNGVGIRNPAGYVLKDRDKIVVEVSTT